MMYVGSNVEDLGHFSSDLIYLDYLCFQAFGINDTIGCYLDLDKMEIKWSKNGMQVFQLVYVTPPLYHYGIPGISYQNNQ